MRPVRPGEGRHALAPGGTVDSLGGKLQRKPVVGHLAAVESEVGSLVETPTERMQDDSDVATDSFYSVKSLYCTACLQVLYCPGQYNAPLRRTLRMLTAHQGRG